MTELLALKANDETILNTIVKNAKPKVIKTTRPKVSNATWSLGSEYLNRVATTAFEYTSNYEDIITALKEAWEKGNKSVKDIQTAYMIGAIVKYLRRCNTKGDGKITQDYITQAEVILGKKNLTKMVKEPTDEHRTQAEQNMYQASAMAFSRLKDRAGLPKGDRGAQNHRDGKTTSDGTNSLSPKDLKLDKIETKVEGATALASIAGLMSKLEEKHTKAFNQEMLTAMHSFREFVATLFPDKK